mgnify:CR=1 FL=1
MRAVCFEIPSYLHPLVWLAVFLWEWFMGETKFGSTIGLIVQVLKRKEK